MIAKVNTLTKEITFTSGKYPSATGDDTVQRLNFEMDRYTGNGTDLGNSDIYIYYTNGRGVTYSHPFPNYTLSDDGLYIKFTWDFAREVAEYASPTRFSVCAKIIDGDVITNEWNSEIVALPVIKSIGHREIGGPDSSSYDEFEELFHNMNEISRELIGQSKEYANVSEAYAKGTMNGIAVQSGEPGYCDNAKYYAEKAVFEAITNADINLIVDE